MPSVWASDITHPRVRPWSSLLYAWEKYGKPRFFKTPPPPDWAPAPAFPAIRPESLSLAREKLAALRAARPDLRVAFVVYPTRDELTRASPGVEEHYQRFLAATRELAGDSAAVIEIRADPRWQVGLYRDGIHPSAEGDAVLAAIIADGLRAADAGNPLP